MPIVEWDDAFSVGIQKIDEQHKKFFSIINRVYDTIQVVQNRKEVGSILKDLQEYTLHHFMTEESWMKMHSYPNIENHKLEHEEATRTVNKLILEYERDGQTVDVDLLKFLSHWLQNHILQADMKYIPYFKGKV
jgi:hemerythrin